MKSIIIKAVVTCLFLLTFGTSCKKSEGPVGPTGPAGPTGPQGNANVSSVVFNVVASDWQYPTGSAYLTKTMPEITTDIFSTGSVNVYWQINSAWVALPYTFPNGSVTQTMGYSYTAGQLKIFVTNSDGSTPATLNTATFKAVITSAS
jgi:hypothetical protein